MNGNASFARILKTSSIMGAASVLNILIGLVRTKMVALLLGPSGLGVIALLQNVMSTAATVAALGIGTVGTRQIAEASGKADGEALAIAERALSIGAPVLALAGAAAFFLLRGPVAAQLFGDGGAVPEVGWLSLGVGLAVAASAQTARLNGLRRIGDLARLSVYSGVLSTGLGVAALWLMGSDGILAFILSAPAASYLVGRYFLGRRGKGAPGGNVPLSALLGQWGVMLRLGSAFMVSSLAGVAGQLAVRALLQRQLGSDGLGQFQAAWAISMTYTSFVLGAMATDYYPRLAASFGDRAAARTLVNEQTEVALMLASPVLLVVLGLAPWIVELLYSRAFDPAAGILRWQVVGDVLKVMSWPLGFVVLAAGDGRTFALIETAGTAVFVGVTWLALPWLGNEATGLAFVCMYLAYLPLIYLASRRLSGFAWRRSVVVQFVLVVAAALLVVGASAWSERLAAGLGVGAAVAFGLHALRRIGGLRQVRGLALLRRRPLAEPPGPAA